jgi:hypothetical protein
LAVYIEPDRKHLDFTRDGYRQYESPINSKKNSNSDKIEKELERMKKEKSSMEI